MKYPFLASILILCALFYYENKKADKKFRNSKEAFWERESLANSTRKKPLDDLTYIIPDLASLPTDIECDDPIIKEKVSDLVSLSEEKIVNFTGMTNTDLKLKYGVANLPFLQQCDNNYTVFVRTLQEWAERLYALGYSNEALCVARYAIDQGTDISKSYFLAADIYLSNGRPDQINDLIKAAETINTPLKNSIISTLKEKTADM